MLILMRTSKNRGHRSLLDVWYRRGFVCFGWREPWGSYFSSVSLKPCASESLVLLGVINQSCGLYA